MDVVVVPSVLRLGPVRFTKEGTGRIDLVYKSLLLDLVKVTMPSISKKLSLLSFN
jgi:hypothetical protein